jgi:hypothetical protein
MAMLVHLRTVTLVVPFDGTSSEHGVLRYTTWVFILTVFFLKREVTLSVRRHYRQHLNVCNAPPRNCVMSLA